MGALSLGINSGSRIKVGDSVVEVKAVVRPTLILVSVDGGKEQAISDQERTEILPTVFVFAGVGSGGTGNRLAFEADRSIKIHRMPDSNEAWSVKNPHIQTLETHAPKM